MLFFHVYLKDLDFGAWVSFLDSSLLVHGYVKLAWLTNPTNFLSAKGGSLGLFIQIWYLYPTLPTLYYQLQSNMISNM